MNDTVNSDGNLLGRAIALVLIVGVAFAAYRLSCGRACFLKSSDCISAAPIVAPAAPEPPLPPAKPKALKPVEKPLAPEADETPAVPAASEAPAAAQPATP